MEKIKTVISAIIMFSTLVISNHNSIAGEVAYTSKVIDVYDLDDDGSLRISNFESDFKGSEFSVSRVTGEIIGEVIPTLLAR